MASRFRRRDREEIPKEPGQEQEKDGRRRALILCTLALPILIGFYIVVLYWSQPRSPGDELRLDQFITLLRQGRIQDATILESDNRVVGRYDRGQYWVAIAGGRETLFARVVQALEEGGVPTSVKQQPLKNLVVPATLLLPALIIVDGLFVLFLLFGRGDTTMGGFGKAGAKRHSVGESKISFADVAGVEEAIEELREVRDYLSNPERFLAMGAAVPKGILLTGPPGCGKTLLARGLAGEAGVPFFSISGSDFVEIFVGVGAARIRDLFRVAKANAPAIIFIDELDAVGRGRTVSAVGGQDEREATLNQLLVEMDGFDSGAGVVVLAATNRPDILDSALLRPGRFDRRIGIDRPDVRGRLEVLRIHARGKPMGEEVDLELVARRTAGFSGADLANVVNEAALLAARRASTTVEARHLLEAIERVVAGPERKSRVLSPEDRLRIAYHEAGHAVVSAATPGADRVGKISIVARGHGGGFTWYVTETDQLVATRTQLLDRITALLGGRASEEVMLGEASSAGEDDLQRAAVMARRMVTDFGMSEALGAYSIKAFVTGVGGDGAPPYSEQLAATIDRETVAILSQTATRARAILEENRHVIEEVAGKLVEVESLEGDVLDSLLAAVAPPPALGYATS